MRPEVTLAEGGTLTLVNADPTLWHDLVSLDREAGGGYLFRGDVIGPARQAPVTGVGSLPPGGYPFYCPVHEFMVGNITVVAPGASRRRRGTAGDPGAGARHGCRAPAVGTY